MISAKHFAMPCRQNTPSCQHAAQAASSDRRSHRIFEPSRRFVLQQSRPGAHDRLVRLRRVSCQHRAGSLGESRALERIIRMHESAIDDAVRGLFEEHRKRLPVQPATDCRQTRRSRAAEAQGQPTGSESSPKTIARRPGSSRNDGGRLGGNTIDC